MKECMMSDTNTTSTHMITFDWFIFSNYYRFRNVSVMSGEVLHSNTIMCFNFSLNKESLSTNFTTLLSSSIFEPPNPISTQKRKWLKKNIITLKWEQFCHGKFPHNKITITIYESIVNNKKIIMQIEDNDWK